MWPCRNRLLALVALCAFLAPTLGLAEPVGRVLAFVSPFCPYCRIFEKEVVSLYDKTTIGKQLPLVLVDTFDPPPEFTEQARIVAFTPCIVVQNLEGKEVGRIRGYRGDEFFWESLDTLYTKMAAKTIKQ